MKLKPEMDRIYFANLALAGLLVSATLCSGQTSNGLIGQAATRSAVTFDDYLFKANILFKQGKLEEALAAVQAAQKVEPTRFESPATAALILHAAKRPAEAHKALEEAEKLAPPEKQEKVKNIARLLAEGTASSPGVPANRLTDSAASNQLTGGARRQYDALVLIIEEADKAKLDTERKALLNEFLVKSEPFLTDHKDQLQLWLLRAVSALELNQERAAREADRELSRLGADKINDPKVNKVLAMLERKGWTAAGLKQMELRAEQERAAEKQREATKAALVASLVGSFQLYQNNKPSNYVLESVRPGEFIKLYYNSPKHASTRHKPGLVWAGSVTNVCDEPFGYEKDVRAVLTGFKSRTSPSDHGMIGEPINIVLYTDGSITPEGAYYAGYRYRRIEVRP